MDTLVYDGDCAFCLRCVLWIQSHFKHVPNVVAWQQIDLASFGLTAEQCQIAVQWVSSDRAKTLSAHKAIARVCKDAGGWISIAGWLMSLPVVSQLSGFVYRWVARNRHRMPGGTTACEIR
jgi:predicted DCC family thiol-disulfide oxidoreductase YuxK